MASFYYPITLVIDGVSAAISAPTVNNLQSATTLSAILTGDNVPGEQGLYVRESLGIQYRWRPALTQVILSKAIIDGSEITVYLNPKAPIVIDSGVIYNNAVRYDNDTLAPGNGSYAVVTSQAGSTINGLDGDVELVEGTNVTINTDPVTNQITISAVDAVGITRVENSSDDGVALVADTGASDGIARIKPLIQGSNVTLTDTPSGVVISSEASTEPFSPQGVMYVAKNGDSVNGDGSFTNPFTTISSAIEASQQNYLVSVAPGTYVENITVNKNIVLTFENCLLEGSITVDADSVLVKNANIHWETETGAAIRVTRVGVRCVFADLQINATAATQAIMVDASGSAWGSGALLEIYDLEVNAGTIRFNAGNVLIDGIAEPTAAIVDINGGEVEIRNAQRLQRVNHNAGRFTLAESKAGVSSVAAGINSSAPLAAGNLLELKNVSTWVSNSQQSFANKTGNCAYIIDGYTRNLSSDVWNGEELWIKSVFDRDIVVSRDGVNYNGSVNTSLFSHLGGIDTALGLRLSNIQSAAGNTSLVADAQGVLKSLIPGTNVTLDSTATTVTINATGTGGGVESVNGLVGEVVIQEGNNITVTVAGNNLIISAGGEAGGLSEVISEGAGISLVGDTGVIDGVARLKSLVPGSNIELVETEESVVINYSGEQPTAGVTTIQGLQGDVTLSSSNPAMTFSVADQNVVINFDGSVQNGTSGEPGAIDLVNLAGGATVVRQVVPGENILVTETDQGVKFDVIAGGGTVKSINGVDPDIAGNVILTPANVQSVNVNGDLMLGPLGVLQPETEDEPVNLAYLSSGLFTIDNGMV